MENKTIFLKINYRKLNNPDELAVQVDRVARKLSNRYGFNPNIYKHKFGYSADDFVKGFCRVRLILMK